MSAPTPGGCAGMPISAEVQSVVSAASHHHHHLVDSSGYVDSETWSVKNARIIALRKEKSRDAARSRRGKENYEFYELAKMLPLPAAITSQLDKASIIRLTISHLRMRDFSSQGDPPWHSYIDMPPTRSVLQGRYQQHPHSGSSAVAHELYEHNLGSHILQSLDGFLFALCSDGRFLYISETVSIYLGLSQVELTGSSVFDYVHPGDHAELAEQLGMKLPPTRLMSPSSSTPSVAEGSPSTATSPGLTSPTSPQDLALNMSSSGGLLERSFIIRMKSTLCKRGIQITSSGYKVIHITGSLRSRMMLTQYSRHPPVVMGFVALAYSLPPPTISEIHLDPTMFVCKVDLNLNVTFCEAKISEFLDYVSEDVVNKSLYSFLHAQDIASIRDSHADLLNKGQVITKYFRWMCKAGGYVWMQATATLTYSKNSTDKSFIFINQVLSKVEDAQCILDISQMTSLPPDLKSDSSGDSPDRDSDSSHHTDMKKPKTSPRPSESYQDQNKKMDATSGKMTKGRRRKSNPESKESKKRKMISTPAISSPTTTPSVISNHEEDQRSKIIISSNDRDSVKELEVNEVRNASPPMSSSPLARKDDQESQENAKKPKIFTEVNHSSPTAPPDVHVTNVLERTMVEERGGTPSTELTSNRLSPMIATQPNGHHREPELPVAGSGGHSWENPPNKDISHHHRETLLHVQSPEQDDRHMGSIIVPKVPYSKAPVQTNTSPKPPESILTPPLSDSSKSQYPLSVASGGVTGMTSLQQDHIDISRTSPATAISSSTYANSASSYVNNSSSYAKSFLSARGSDLSASHPALLAKSPTAYDSLDSQSSSMKQEPLYNHPRVITAVSSAYSGMAYGNYSQYNNFQQYGSPIAAAHSYQTNPYGDPSMYKNYRSGHEMPMDLSYNNVGSFSNAAAMSLLHSNATGSSHPYFHASKMSYSASDGGLHSIHEKAQIEEAVRAAQQKV